MDLVTAERLTLETMRTEGLLETGWTFRWDDARRRFGCCRYDRKRITLSRHLTALNSRDEVVNTIRHEVAHAICGKEAGHGPVWRKVCIALGGDGRRCYTPEWAGGTIVQPSRTVRLTAAMLLPEKVR